MQERDDLIRRWFSLWLEGKDNGIAEIFAPDARYIESWGPEYQGVPAIEHWFREWNTRGRVLTWECGQTFHKETETVATWRFVCSMRGRAPQGFDGVSLIRWTPEGKIAFWQEFYCEENRYDPYQNGPVPQFRHTAPNGE